MVPVHDYEKRYAEAFAITKMRTFKHEPFFIAGGGGGGELIRGTLRYMERHGLCATLDVCSTYYTHAMEHCTSISSVNVPTLLRNN